MYQFLKNSLKSILPVNVFQRGEPFFRSILYGWYKGKKYHCELCNARLRNFIRLPNKDLVCPRCASLPRTRRLYKILKEKELLRGKILHFSPPFSLYKKLKQIADLQYISSDFENEFLADEKYDLTAIAVPNNSFDLFIAYHVLEHIENDKKAMQELYRVTKNGGQGLIQTPFKKGKIYEDFSIKTPEDRLLHFGQKDHVRIYSVTGLVERLTSVGFAVEVLNFEEEPTNFYGYKVEETVLLVKKKGRGG